FSCELPNEHFSAMFDRFTANPDLLPGMLELSDIGIAAQTQTRLEPIMRVPQLLVAYVPSDMHMYARSGRAYDALRNWADSERKRDNKFDVTGEMVRKQAYHGSDKIWERLFANVIAGREKGGRAHAKEKVQLLLDENKHRYPNASKAKLDSLSTAHAYALTFGQRWSNS